MRKIHITNKDKRNKQFDSEEDEDYKLGKQGKTLSAAARINLLEEDLKEYKAFSLFIHAFNK